LTPVISDVAIRIADVAMMGEADVSSPSLANTSAWAGVRVWWVGAWRCPRGTARAFTTVRFA
jgi:hypothetical protein